MVKQELDIYEEAIRAYAGIHGLSIDEARRQFSIAEKETNSKIGQRRTQADLEGSDQNSVLFWKGGRGIG
ncbi:MAG: hypothetical protein PVJ09_01260 [Candidatus Woesebacteria bacterium]|jgi:hypothetical protein